MRSILMTLFAVVLLSSCDNDLKIINRDFSVSLKAIDGGTPTVGRSIKCTFSVNGLDLANSDELFTTFSVKDGSGKILVENDEYTPGETIIYDYQEAGKMIFDYVPATSGMQSLILSVSSEIITRSDTVVINVVNSN